VTQPSGPKVVCTHKGISLDGRQSDRRATWVHGRRPVYHPTIQIPGIPLRLRVLTGVCSAEVASTP